MVRPPSFELLWPDLFSFIARGSGCARVDAATGDGFESMRGWFRRKLAASWPCGDVITEAFSSPIEAFRRTNVQPLDQHALLRRASGPPRRRAGDAHGDARDAGLRPRRP